MELSKEELYALISKIIESYEEEKEREKERIPMYVLFSGDWDKRFSCFFDQFEQKEEYQWIGVLSKEQMENTSFLDLAMGSCEKLLLREEAEKIRAYEKTTVIPVFHRDLLAKAALCIPDNFEVSWIQKAMETGGKIILMANGFDKFTGKEPVPYREKVLSYIQTLLEYEIEIKVIKEER